LNNIKVIKIYSNLTMSNPLATNNRFNALKSGDKLYRPPNSNKNRSITKVKKHAEEEQWVLEDPEKGNPFVKKKFDINTESFPILSENVDIIHSTMQYREKIKKLFQKRVKKKDTVKPGMIRWRKNKNINCWIREDGCTNEIDEWKEIEEYYVIDDLIYNMILRWQTYRDEQNELLLDIFIN
jgi:hypothetical protein